MIVGVARHRETTDLTPREVKALRVLWEGNPIGSMLDSGIPEGRFGAALLPLLGGRLPWRILDLLPPDRPGTWDLEAARRNAGRVGLWAAHHHHALIAFGRGVAGAFGLEGDYGETGFLEDGAPYLILPHPMARNRWINRRDRRERIKRWVDTFWLLYSSSDADAPVSPGSMATPTGP
jgi:hypothetical protein